MSKDKMVLANNKKASYEYFLEERIEAGLVLTGTEIKSLRNNGASLKESYVTINSKNEVEIVNMTIAPYERGNIFNVDPTRPRKLLLHKKEILKLNQQIKEKGYTLVPVSLYIIKGKAKLEIALAKGKKLYDKRESIKKKDIERNMQRKIEY